MDSSVSSDEPRRRTRTLTKQEQIQLGVLANAYNSMSGALEEIKDTLRGKGEDIGMVARVIRNEEEIQGVKNEVRDLRESVNKSLQEIKDEIKKAPEKKVTASDPNVLTLRDLWNDLFKPVIVGLIIWVLFTLGPQIQNLIFMHK